MYVCLFVLFACMLVYNVLCVYVFLFFVCFCFVCLFVSGKCIASQAGATFFSISASSLTSKWVCGELAVPCFGSALDSIIACCSRRIHELSVWCW